jgi:hypothetical protein
MGLHKVNNGQNSRLRSALFYSKRYSLVRAGSCIGLPSYAHSAYIAQSECPAEQSYHKDRSTKPSYMTRFT